MYKEQYDRLTSDREGFLQQARAHSELTIPSLIPPDGTGNSFNNLHKPFQSIGAFGVNSLANKLTGALYPPTEPFFKLDVVTSSEEVESMSPQQLVLMDEKLSAIEQKILSEMTKRGDRSAITEAVKHLVVGGNVLLYVGDEITTFYPLDSYVALRDGEGNLLKTITKDTLSYEIFKESHPELTDVHSAHQGGRSYAPKTIDVYTACVRKDGYWKVQEEAAGKLIASSKSRHPIDKPPYLALRFNRIDKQSYGRGYVESLYGDLRSLENLWQAMVEGSAINARVVFLVNPNGFTSQRLFEESANGAVIPGVASDITTAKVDKSADLAVTANQIQQIEARLQQAFLLASSAQRQAERVTATEVQMVVAELEQVLGGVYAVLSEEFQRPYVNRLVSVLMKAKAIPEWPEGVIDVSIITGSAGVGRGIDRERMVQFIQTLTQTLGPDVFKEYANIGTTISRLAASFGINLQGLIKTAEERQAEQAQAQQQQMMSELGPQAISAAGNVATAQIQTQGDTPNGDQEEDQPPV